jgi:hypothetical protein
MLHSKEVSPGSKEEWHHDSCDGGACGDDDSGKRFECADGAEHIGWAKHAG